MVIASQLRAGMAIRFEQHIFKVLSAEYHPGQGKMGGVTHTHLLNLDTGTYKDHGFRSDLRLEEIPLICRIDTADEVEYFRHGGILHYVLRNLLKAA